MEENGLGWAGWIGVAGGIAGVLSVIVALLSWLGPSRREVWDDLATDATYRADIAASLRDGSLGQRYRNGLAGGLALLDRHFGAASSAKALGLCIIIALVYAYAGFFLVWGLGGPGVVGGLHLMPRDAEQPARLIAGAIVMIAPFIGYGLGRYLGPRVRRFERRLVTRLQMTRVLRRRWRSKRRAVDRLYRFGAAVALVLVVALSVVILPERRVGIVALALLVGALPVLGVAMAVHVRSWFQSDWTGALVSTTAGAAGVALALALAGAVAVGFFPKPGAFPGALGAMVGLGGLGVFSGLGFVHELSILLLVFFLVLPLINGGVDWGSWWVTRRLGAHLVGAFDRGAGALRLALVALRHGIFDLAIAAGMLLGMAFMLALGFEAYNQASLWQASLWQASLWQGEGAFDLEAYVEGAAAAPFGEGAWLTLMLLTTLVPTFLHVAVVWMSPLGFVFLSAGRRRWATDLERWDDLDEATRSRTRRAVAAYVAHDRIGLWLLAGLLSIAWFALMAVAIAFLHQGGFAAYVAGAAYRGIDTARWLGGS